MTERLKAMLPSWEQVLIPLRDHYSEIIFAVALLEVFLAMLVFAYNRRYLRKVGRWFRDDVLKECSGPSSTLGRWLQVEHLLHTFRVEYVQKLETKTTEQCREEYHKLTNEKSHTVYAYAKWARISFNLFYDLIPTFPMLGILGTVIAIACQFSTAADAHNESEMILRSVTQNFGMAIWTTIFGIGFGILFTVVNALFVESGTQKCFELEKTARQSLDEVLHIIATQRDLIASSSMEPGDERSKTAPAPHRKSKKHARGHHNAGE
jgi:MotA/TolQ/ExbB proton channel family.